MKWSWRIGRIFGADIHAHATFPFLLAGVALIGLRGGASPSAVLATIVLIVAVFATVVLHESAHLLVARRFGIRTRDITLLPVGGIAHLERAPRGPRQELLIALAGPAVNAALAALLYIGSATLGGGAVQLEVAGPRASVTPGTVVAQLTVINIWLAALGLIPALPMDGGHALRAVLRLRGCDYATATITAARIGRIFAVFLGLTGLLVFGSLVLVVIASLVWVATSSEATTMQTSAALADVPLASVMITDVHTLAPGDVLARAARLTMDGFQQDFPVVEHGELVGLLTRDDLIRGLSHHGSAATVRSTMRRDVPTVQVDDTPGTAVNALVAARGTMVPVVSGGRLLGALTEENVSEFLTLRAAQRTLPAATNDHAQDTMPEDRRPCVPF